MKWIPIRGTVACVCLLTAAVPGRVRGAVPADTLLIEDVTVLPMDADTALEERSVLVVDGRIDWMGPAARRPVPPGATVLDGRGRFLMPGLTDAHVHLRDTTELAGYLAHGVTTVFQLSGPQGEIGDLRVLRGEIELGERLGPRLLLAGRLIDGDPPLFGSAADAVTTTDDGRDLVRARVREGYDLVKVYNRLPRVVLTSVVEEAHHYGLPVFGHVPRAEGREGALEHALDAGMDVVAHGEEYFFTRFYRGIEDGLDGGGVPAVDTAGLAETVAMTREAGAYVIPNLSFVRQTRAWLDDPESVFEDPESAYLPPERRRSWRGQHPGNREDVDRFDRRERAKAGFLDLLTLGLHEEGVPLLAGTDASFAGLYPGASLHLELEELVRAGLTPFEALRTATVMPGRLLERMRPEAAPSGVIRPGARADLVLLDGDPRQDLAALEQMVGVVVAGRWLDAEALETLRPTWPPELPADAGVLEAETRAVAVTRDGALWVATGREGLVRIRDGRVRRYTEGDGLMSDGVADLLETRDGRLWAVGLGGYAVWDGEAWTPAPLGGPEYRVIFSAYQEPASGRVWLAGNGGVARFDSRAGWTEVTEADGLPHQVVHGAIVDDDGRAWLACRRGLARVRAGQVEEVLFPDLNIRTALKAPDGTLWFGTSDGVRGWDGRAWTAALEGRTVYPKLVAGDGTLWAGSASSGLFRFRDGSWEHVDVPDGLAGAEIHDLAEGPGGRIWLATSAGLGWVEP